MAYCRDEELKEWYRYDDNQVRQITGSIKEELVNTQNLYMLIYRKKADKKKKKS